MTYVLKGSHTFCSAVVVTHNCPRHIERCMKALDRQERKFDRVIIVDSGSEDTSYLDQYEALPYLKVIKGAKGIGFCRANNVAIPHLIDESDYIAFVNPDAFLSESFVKEALAFMENDKNRQIGTITGLVEGYDMERDAPTGVADTTGIFRKWYGKWYDRDQGKSVEDERYTEAEIVPAICGALMFCRKEALQQSMVHGNEVFDTTFYMYKDDIDLSRRIRKAGWEVAFVPWLKAYHCRGWNRKRYKMPRKLRLLSARNDLRIDRRNHSPYLAYSLAKYLLVKLVNL
ncbi:glycosyltransferase [Simkania negevensis]|uniref:Glycosyltransferase n=1 Tax=Simkania negevensis TaxID=83561 RepID=A0ABS3ARP2_9BACT|nr:glycosyltransferase [Simkania negevensis]